MTFDEIYGIDTRIGNPYRVLGNLEFKNHIQLCDYAYRALTSSNTLYISF